MTDTNAVDVQTNRGVKSGAAVSAQGRWLLLATSAIVVPLLILLILEFSLRAAGVGYDTALLTPCTVRGVPSSCYNLFFAAPYFPAGMVQVPRLYSIPVLKGPKTYRIFVLGESAAMGDPDAAYGWSRYLEVMLRRQYPQMKFDVVNTGSVAINSHVVLRIAEGLADQHPDLFIIYSGNNEVVGPYGPGTVLTSSAMSMPVVRASIFYRSSRVGQLLTKLGTQKKEWHGMEMFLDKQVPASSPLMKKVYSNYERNLRETILVAQKVGAAVIVATTATNLEDCAPFASQHRQGLTHEQLREWESLVKRGDELKTAHSDPEALKLYLEAVKIDDQYAELEFRIAQCLRNLGDTKSARDHFIHARDLDTLRFRADSRINDINRSVPSSMQGVTIVDTDELLSQASADGIIGSDLIYEHVHLTPAASYLFAKAIFNEVSERLPAPERAGGDVMSEAECERLLALTNFDRARLAQEMARRLQRPPFTNQLNHAELLLGYEMQQQSFQENPNDTALEYQAAIAHAPDDIMLHYHYGMFLFQYNHQAAAQELAMAQPWDGFPVFMPDGTRVK